MRGLTPRARGCSHDVVKRVIILVDRGVAFSYHVFHARTKSPLRLAMFYGYKGITRRVRK